MKKYKYGNSVFTLKQIEFILKRKYPVKWKEKLDIMTMYPVGDIVIRNCLRCGNKFEASGKYIRVCGRCKNSEEWKEHEHAIL